MTTHAADRNPPTERPDGLAPRGGQQKAAPGPLRRLWDYLLFQPLRRVNAESRAYLASEAAGRFDWKVPAVLVTAAVSLTVQYYLVLRPPRGAVEALERVGIDYWVAGCLLVYFVIPALVIRLAFRERLRDYGVKLRGAFADLWAYAVMFAVMVPLLLLVSRSAEFQKTYPFTQIDRRAPLWPQLGRWEPQYALQFFGLEFFFRGFLVHGTKHRFGVYSIFVMTVPYCMIHYGKPMPEAFASIVAGIVLGFMSLKNRSIWLGAVIHVTVAWSMDLVSLWRQGLLG